MYKTKAYGWLTKDKINDGTWEKELNELGGKILFVSHNTDHEVIVIYEV